MNDPIRDRIGVAIALLLIALAALISLRCGTSSAEMSARAAEAKPPAPGPAGSDTPAAVPHGDHNPHHGGAVLMLRDLHYEIVFEPSGRVAVYFSDAVRKDLPASIVSDVYIEIDRPPHHSGRMMEHKTEHKIEHKIEQKMEQKMERVDMTIDHAGESWEGKAMPVKQDDAVVRVAFTFQGEATTVDLPYHLYWKPAGAGTR